MADRAGAAYTVTRQPHSSKPWLVSCSCGLLHVDVAEDEVGKIMSIHWMVAHLPEVAVSGAQPPDESSTIGPEGIG